MCIYVYIYIYMYISWSNEIEECITIGDEIEPGLGSAGEASAAGAGAAPENQWY